MTFMQIAEKKYLCLFEDTSDINTDLYKKQF